MKTKTCYACGKSISAQNEIGINLKLLGRNITNFYCYGCLAEQFEIEVDELLARMEELKNQGCALFE